jgi:hypothetical protein
LYLKVIVDPRSRISQNDVDSALFQHHATPTVLQQISEAELPRLILQIFGGGAVVDGMFYRPYVRIVMRFTMDSL